MATLTQTIINTAGYEGLALATFLRRLQEHSIDLVVDVRANPISRKPGFSKNSLRIALGEKGIEYVHFPGLGIPSAVRKRIVDRDELFAYYKEVLLPSHAEDEQKVADLCQCRNAVLICFEEDPKMCHRLRLAEDLRRYGFSLSHLR